MTLSSSQLEAFSEVARTSSFSKAAKNLHVTQSALSQRIRNLEAKLATGLFIRDPSGLRLTAVGEELLRHCHIRESLETEFLNQMSSTQSALGGVIRIAGFSSVMRSIVMPSLDGLVANNSDLNIEFFTRELRDLASMLTRNEVDLIITTDQPFRHEVISRVIGFEENILVESVKLAKQRNEIYLDHDPDDDITANFFKINKRESKKIHRNYLDEVYSIIDGVKRGWGRAVLPKHLIKNDNTLRILKNLKPLKTPVMIQYFRQPFYSKIHTKIVDEICAHAPNLFEK
jgi:DNA-binding transcriptional LysR family regulator